MPECVLHGGSLRDPVALLTLDRWGAGEDDLPCLAGRGLSGGEWQVKHIRRLLLPIVVTRRVDKRDGQ